MQPWKIWVSATVVVTALIAAAAAGLLLALVSRGLSARAEPSSLEAFVARRLRHLATPADARALGTSLPAAPEVVRAGMEHFADHCASCHANDGSGQTTIGQNLYPKAPDMRLPTTQALSDGELFYIIENGVRFTGMPAWGSGDSESARDTWQLVAFIRHLPKLTADEVAQMEALNPKGAAEREQEAEIDKFLGGDTETPPSGQPHRHR